jgi:hypothetical protein
MNSPANPYISLDDVKDQLSIDEGLTIHDRRLQLLIGAAIDWAENFTGRSLGELLELDSPADSDAVPLPDPKDSPTFERARDQNPDGEFPGVVAVNGWADWDEKTWRDYWSNNPILKNDAKPLRRDVHAAVLLKIETLFDRNPDNYLLLTQTAEAMLFPYRIGMGV